MGDSFELQEIRLDAAHRHGGKFDRWTIAQRLEAEASHASPAEVTTGRSGLVGEKTELVSRESKLDRWLSRQAKDLLEPTQWSEHNQREQQDLQGGLHHNFSWMAPQGTRPDVPARTHRD